LLPTIEPGLGTEQRGTLSQEKAAEAAMQQILEFFTVLKQAMILEGYIFRLQMMDLK
jgi:hypothetical protein